jgi:hypothetical protein
VAVAVTYGGHGSHMCLVSDNVLMDMHFSRACCVSHAARFEVNKGLLMHCLCMHDLAAFPPPQPTLKTSACWVRPGRASAQGLLHRLGFWGVCQCHF